MHIIRGITMRATFSCALAFSSFACGAAPAPTSDDIGQVMHGRWDRQATASEPKSVLTINSLKIGSTDAANEQDAINGIPRGAAVTAVLVDFTVRSYYGDSVQAVRRTREASVYRDKFGAWEMKMGSARGQDATTSEPVSK